MVSFEPPSDVQPIGQERSVRDPPLKAAAQTIPAEVRTEEPNSTFLPVSRLDQWRKQIYSVSIWVNSLHAQNNQIFNHPLIFWGKIVITPDRAPQLDTVLIGSLRKEHLNTIQTGQFTLFEQKAFMQQIFPFELEELLLPAHKGLGIWLFCVQ